MALLSMAARMMDFFEKFEICFRTDFHVEHLPLVKVREKKLRKRLFVDDIMAMTFYVWLSLLARGNPKTYRYPDTALGFLHS